jgi:tetratricopeptide (TPR) repeat protein
MIASRTCALSTTPVVKPAESVLWAYIAVIRRPEAHYLHTLALAHYRAGHYDQAVAACRQSFKVAPGWQGRAANWLLLGMALERKGEKEEARRCLNTVTKWYAAVRAGKRPPASPPDMPLPDWLEFQVLYREAQPMLSRP